ncbi:aldehyde dehydrogenase family protein, partial [Rhizobium ruizarguesonis]
FWNMGENCSATSRLIVHSKVKDELLKRIVAYMREWKTGDPLEPVNRIGALVSKAHVEKVKSFRDDAKTEKLSVAHGGET